MSDITATLYTDPYSPDCWRYQPTVRQLQRAFRELDWDYRFTVAVPTPLAAGSDDLDAARDTARHAASAAGMPLADDAFADGLPASWAACEALVAVRRDAPDAVGRYLHRLQAAVFAEGTPPDDADTLARLAREVPGIDPERVREAVGDRPVTAALGADLARASAVVATLDRRSVRGTPRTAPLGDRVSGATPEDRGFVPPVVHVEGPDGDVVVDLREGFGAVRDAVRRFDPDAGETPATMDQLGRKAMRAYGMAQHAAESFAYGEYDRRIREFIDASGPAFTAELAACIDIDIVTCRVTTREMRLAGDIERTPWGAWDRPV